MINIYESVCVFITAGPITKLFAGGGGGEWRTCAMIDDEPRPVWMSPLVTHVKLSPAKKTFHQLVYGHVTVVLGIKSDSYKLFINLALLGHVTENFNF